MTKGKAATVTAALINADYYARASQIGDGTWVVHASSPSAPVDVDAVKAFADAQAVNAETNEVTFS